MESFARYDSSKLQNKKIYLTFDMDWANDEVLDFFYNMICGYYVVCHSSNGVARQIPGR